MGIFGPTYGLIGEFYKKHSRAPETVTVTVEKKRVQMHNKGKGVYRSSDGKTTFTFKQLFGEIPEKNNWPKD